MNVDDFVLALESSQIVQVLAAETVRVEVSLPGLGISPIITLRAKPTVMGGQHIQANVHSGRS